MYNIEYFNQITKVINKIGDTQSDNIKEMAVLFAENIKNGKIIHTFGTGHSHMVGIEMFGRAGGLANVNAMVDPDTITSFGARRSCAMEKVSGVADVIYDSYKIEKGDIMIITSNSGRNAVPVEMAMRCKKEGIYCIGLTNLQQSKEITSRHFSGQKLYEICDFVLDSCVPFGDSMCEIGGAKTGPASSIATMIIVNAIINEACLILEKENITLPIFQSQNLDGFDNDALYEKYEKRVKHF